MTDKPLIDHETLGFFVDQRFGHNVAEYVKSVATKKLIENPNQNIAIDQDWVDKSSRLTVNKLADLPKGSNDVIFTFGSNPADTTQIGNVESWKQAIRDAKHLSTDLKGDIVVLTVAEGPRSTEFVFARPEQFDFIKKSPLFS